MTQLSAVFTPPALAELLSSPAPGVSSHGSQPNTVRVDSEGTQRRGGVGHHLKGKKRTTKQQRSDVLTCNMGISILAKLPSYLRPHRQPTLNFSPSAANLLLPIGSGPTTHLAAQPETKGWVLASQPLVLTPHRKDRVSASSCVSAKSLQSCLTLCDPTDCSLLGFSVHGILQA